MNGKATVDLPSCPHPRAVVGVPAAAALARTTPLGGAVAAELAGAGTTVRSHGPGAGASFLRPGVAI